jgi:hypothetical protein
MVIECGGGRFFQVQGQRHNFQKREKHSIASQNSLGTVFGQASADS